MRIATTLFLMLTLVVPAFAGCVQPGAVDDDESPDGSTDPDGGDSGADGDDGLPMPDPVDLGDVDLGGMGFPPEACTADATAANAPRNGDPANDAASDVGYASNASHVLVRWVWREPLEDVTFRVYRAPLHGTEALLAEVAPERDDAEAERVLTQTDARFPGLDAQLVDEFGDLAGQDLASVLDFLAEHPFLAQFVAARQYPVALVLGLGHLDAKVQPGHHYTYRVEAVTANATATLGNVTVEAGRPTPVPAPEGLTCVDLGPTSGLRDPAAAEWTPPLAERRFDRTILLRWNDSTSQSLRDGAWSAGFDVLRAPVQGDTLDLANLTLTRVNGELPVHPMPSSASADDAPLNITLPPKGLGGIDIGRPGAPSGGPDKFGEDPRPRPRTNLTVRDGAPAAISFHYADRVPAAGDYVYAVAPRDLLGHTPEWQSEPDAFSNPVRARAYDLAPPAIVRNLTANVPPSNDSVTLQWENPASQDLAHVVVYRAYDRTAAPPSADCDDPAACWVEAARVTGTTWTDTDGTLEQVRWYLVQPVDAAGNRGAFTGPEPAVLHDVTPPAPPALAIDKASFSRTNGASTRVNVFAGDDDTTRVRVQCRYGSSGTWLPVRDVALNGSRTIDLADVYDVPVRVEDVECRARAVDAQGNVGPLGNTVRVDAFAETALESPPTPILVNATAAPGFTLPSQIDLPTYDPGSGIQVPGGDFDVSLGDAGPALDVTVRWAMPETPHLALFKVARVNLSSETVTTVDVPADARQFVDRNVHAGLSYAYNVTAVLVDGQSATSGTRTAHVVETSDADGPPRVTRTLGDLAWHSTNFDTRNGDGFAGIRWSCPSCTEHIDYAIYRSVREHGDYAQVTPVFSPLDEKERLSLTPNEVVSHVDESAERPGYWYVVVGYDGRTGEPVAATDPLQAGTPARPAPVDWSTTPLQQSLAFDLPTCSGATPIPSAPLFFAGDFRVTVTSWTRTDPSHLSGRGEITLNTPQGPATETVRFDGLRVDAKNRVCHGTAVVDANLDPVRVANAVGPDFDIHRMELQPSGAKPDYALADVTVRLPQASPVNLSGAVQDRLPLKGVAMGSDLWWAFLTDLGAAGQRCDTAFVEFPQERFPSTFVPLGTLKATPAGLAFADGCLRHEERFHDLVVDRPTPSTFDAGDANDGLLRGTYVATGPVRLAADGVHGAFARAASAPPLAWISSMPFGFNVRVDGPVSLALDGSRIANGTASDATVTFRHHTRADGDAVTPTLRVDAAELTVLPGGALYANVTVPNGIHWRDAFTLDAAQWELLLGSTTLPAPPKTALVASHGYDARNVTGLGFAYLEPGLNLRDTGATLTWACDGGAAFTAAVDVTIRRGGVTDRILGDVSDANPVALDMYGYDAELTRFAATFLDNALHWSDFTGEVHVPFPTNVTIPLVDMWLDAPGGCVGGGRVPSDAQSHVLDYWDVPAGIEAVEFRDAAFGTSGNGTRLLWAIGNVTLPHLALPASDVSDLALPSEAAFREDGRFFKLRLLQGDAEYRLDGYPFLLSGVRLSDVGETPGWDAAATVDAPPATGDAFWAHTGFIDVAGRLVTPYFGPVQSVNGPEPRVRFLAEDDYLGFTAQPRVRKVWVDLDAVQVTYEYDLAYATNATGAGRFVGFEDYEFLPTGAILGLLGDAMDAANATLAEGEGTIRDTLDEVTAGVNATFAALEQEVRTPFRDARHEVNVTLAGVESRLHAEIDQAFTDPTQARGDLEALRATIESETALVEGTVQDTIRPAHETLGDAERELVQLRRELRQARSTLRHMELQLEEAVEYVEQQDAYQWTLLASETFDVPGSTEVASAPEAMKAALAEVRALREEADVALAEVEAAIADVQGLVRDVRDTVKAVEADVLRFTRELESAVNDALDIVDDPTADLTQLNTQLKQEVTATVAVAKARLNGILFLVENALIGKLDHARTLTLDMLQDVENAIIANFTLVQDVKDEVFEEITTRAEALLAPLRVVHLDTAAVVEPERLGVFLGFSSGLAALGALAETRNGTTWNASLESDMRDWGTDLFGWSTNKTDTYVQLTEDVHADLVTEEWRNATVVLNAHRSAGHALPAYDNVGGGTGGLLDDWGVSVKEVRGDVQIEPVGLNEWQLDALRLAVHLDLSPGDDGEPLLVADTIRFEVNRHGDYLFAGEGITSSLYDSDIVADATVLLNPTEPTFEGGLTLYDLEIETLEIEEASAALGVGRTLFYLGAGFDAQLSGAPGGGDVNLGGTVLFGTVNPSSPVLQQHFPDVVEKMAEIPGNDGTARLTGFYVRAYGDMPLYENGCTLRANVGGRVAVWYFAGDTGDSAYGGMLGGYLYGKALCSVSARGDVTLVYSVQGDEERFDGDAWVAGGLGDCEPGTWKSWGSRWWDDSWCWTAGAALDLSYRSDRNPGWDVDYDLDSE